MPRLSKIFTALRTPLMFLAAWSSAGVFPTSASLATDEPPSPEAASRAVEAPQPADLPPALKVGARARTTQLKLAVLPIVVIVSDRDSYLAALSGWSIAARYPILIDDGSDLATEQIARFARAFQATHLVYWSEPAGAKSGGSWNTEPGAVDAAVLAAWNETPGPAPALTLPARFKALGLTPPGVVVANAADPAWTAAAALAAGRGQPIHWITTPKPNLHSSMPLAEAQALDASIAEFCTKQGYAWNQLGDDIDTITICSALPHIVQVQSPSKDEIALTDVLGRRSADLTQRWAWTGQVFFGPAQSAYVAMCSLFLHPSSAWLFDSYPDDGAWKEYDQAPAADIFRQVKFTVDLVDKPTQSIQDWISRTRQPLAADIIFVNTKGNADFFELLPGYGRSGDVPMLSRPALVHFTHSWSARSPLSRNTIGGRWLERGAFAYYGSMSEPGLSAFLPNRNVAARLASGFAWGAAPRYDGGRPWKLTLIGDPLFTLGPAAPRIDASKLSAAEKELLLPLRTVGPVDLSAQLATDIAAGRFAQALRALVMLDRDADAAALASGLLRERAKDVTPAVARAAILPLWRQGKSADLVKAFEILSPASKPDQDGQSRDALWLALTPVLQGRAKVNADGTTDVELSAPLLDLLKQNIRSEQLRADLLALAMGWARQHGRPAAQSMLKSYRDALTDAGLRKQADAAIGDFGQRPQ